MPQNILEIVAGLPPRVQTIIDDATKLAREELNVEVLDSSMVLLVIIRLGDTYSSAKWLHSIGLDEARILHAIQSTFGARDELKQVKDAWNVRRPVPAIITFALPTIQMINRLHERAHDPHANGQVYVANVLEAIAHTDSRAVKQIFGSVGLDMADVRQKLNIPTIQDLEKLYARRN